MKISFDPKKSTEAVSNILSKASDIGKKTVDDVQKSAVELSEKAKQDSYLRRLKKYNPLFLAVYESESFHRPSMIMIADSSSRQGIDVCEGAIGWLSTEADIEVLCLYTEFAENCGIHFFPTISTDAFYYVDPFDRDRFIRTDCIFSKAHEERLAELKHIAHSLGAKSCSIEISESTAEVCSLSKKMGFGGTSKFINVKGSSEQNGYHKDTNQRTGRIVAEFEGSDTPKRPKLKWFAQDETITKLIEMRCKNSNSIKSEILELSGTSSATMSQKTALAIDGTVSKMGFKGNYTLENQATKESHTKLIFSIVF